MSKTFRHLYLGLLGSLLCTNATAQTWTLLSSSNPVFATPGLPAGSSVQPVAVGQNDSDGQSLRFKIEQNSAFDGHWLRVGSAFQAVARTGVTGVLGPARPGAEANHQFLQLSQFADSGPNDSIAFFAEAGPAGSSGNARGFWRWQGGQNQELARQGTDGNLGPNLGAGWTFYGFASTNDIHLNVGPNGVAMAHEVVPPVGSRRSGLVLLRASGNQPCMVQSDTGAALGPNLPGASFNSGSYVTARHGAQYFVQALATDSATREGIWEVCAGTPRPIAVSGLAGSLGPDVGSLTARFNTIRTLPKPHANNTQVFMASYRFSDTAPSLQGGVWRHQNGSNRLLAQTDDTSASLGPNYQGARFEFFDTINSSFDSADAHVAFETSVRTPSNTSIRGLWRIRPGGNPEPVVLEGQPGFGAPGSGQVFTRIDDWKLFGNGDLVAEVVSTFGPSGLYAFRIGRPPTLLLAANQTISLQIGGSASNALVQSFSLIQGNGFATNTDSGTDAWAATDGGILVSATITSGGNNANILMRLQAADLNKFFADGFEN
jgi:hypothetical protein